MPIAIDAHGPVWMIGRGLGAPALNAELERRNLRRVQLREAVVVGQIDLGLWNNSRVVDVYLVREGLRTCLGRIQVSDLTMTTVDTLAGWIAEMLAEAITSPRAPAANIACRE